MTSAYLQVALCSLVVKFELFQVCVQRIDFPFGQHFVVEPALQERQLGLTRGVLMTTAEHLCKAQA
jgi:hypothetical protein